MFHVPVSFVYNAVLTPALRRTVMRELAQCGAKHLVLSSIMIQEMMRDAAVVKDVRKELDQAGITLLDAHAPYGPECDLYAANADMLPRQKFAIELAGMFQTKTITIHVGNNNRLPDVPFEEHIKNMKRALTELLPVAERCGVIICIENIWHKSNTVDVLWELKNAFPTDHLGFCFDAGHANLMDEGRNHPQSPAFSAWMGETPRWNSHILEDMLPQIVNCHLHDNDGTGDQHRNIGNGNVKWDHVIPLLKKAPRLQVIQCEVDMVRDVPVTIRDVVEAFERLGGIGN